MRPTRMAGVVCAFAAALAAAAPVPAKKKERSEVVLSGDCVQGSAGLLVDRDEVRARVPEPFEPVEVGGKAAIFLYTLECDEYRVDGGPPELNRPAAIAAFVTRPESDGPEAFDMYGTHSHEDVVEAYEELGLEFGLVQPSFDLDHLGWALVSLSSSVAAPDAPFEYELAGTETPRDGIEFPSVHWQLGSRGFVRHSYVHSPFRAAAALAEVRAPAGSPLADMMGAESVATGGALFRYGFEGISELAVP